jgi:ABC-type transport system substrate-binding protein
MARNKKKEETPVLKLEAEAPVLQRRRIKSFKPKKDIILSPSFELRKINPPKIWPEKKQWKHLFKVLSGKEKILFSLLFAIAIASLVFICLSLYYRGTESTAADGGTIVEGSINQPRFINPIYTNSDIDRDLSELIFSGLMKYDKDMAIVPDLALKYPEIEDEGRIYKFYLKDNLLWQDGTPLTADDVVFTIKTIQNPELKSPYLANWVGVKVEKISDTGIRFTLQKPYSAFIENCTTKIIPKHIWEKVSAESFPFQSYNLENAIGSGLYRIKEVKRDSAKQQVEYIMLEKNRTYFGAKPYISNIKFTFFASQEELVKAAKKGKLTGMDASLGELDLKKWGKNTVSLPRYFALFLNPTKNEILKEKDIRIALSYGTNKKEISNDILDSPLIPGFYGISEPTQIFSYDPERAASMLDALGYKDTDGNGIREKTISKIPAFQFKSRLTIGSSGKEVTELQKCLKIEETAYYGTVTKEAVIAFQEKYADEILKPAGYDKGTGIVGVGTRDKLNVICFPNPNQLTELRFTLITVDQPQMQTIAETVKEQWGKIGVDIEIQTYPILQLEQEFIKSRNYDILLFGEVLGAIPDPFPFWHSSQVNDPGLNLCMYENKDLDKLLEDIRKISDDVQRKENLASIQNLIIKDAPAIFLYSPKFTYLVSNSVKGISDKKAVNISKRFVDIENWYIKTKRIWK